MSPEDAYRVIRDAKKNLKPENSAGGKREFAVWTSDDDIEDGVQIYHITKRRSVILDHDLITPLVGRFVGVYNSNLNRNDFLEDVRWAHEN